jgi:hypothetical protein
VNEDQTSRTLTPNFGRAFIRVFMALLLFCVIGAVSARYQNGQWSSADYFASLAIPLLLAPVCVYLMFVPRRICWSAAEFQIRPRFGEFGLYRGPSSTPTAPAKMSSYSSSPASARSRFSQGLFRVRSGGHFNPSSRQTTPTRRHLSGSAQKKSDGNATPSQVVQPNLAASL